MPKKGYKGPLAGPNNDFYVETYRTTYAGKSKPQPIHVQTHRTSEKCPLDRDNLHPGLTSLWFVHGVHTASHATALILESAAGYDHPNVRLIMGGERSIPSAALPTDVDADLIRNIANNPDPRD